MKKIVLLLILLFFATRSIAQIPFITNYSPVEYNAAPQNWALIQDERGILYIGNNEGVIEYDGISWQIIKTPSAVRSLAKDSVGRIYVGVQGDFGYLEISSNGVYQYKSLKEKFSTENYEFNDISKIYILGKSIFFQSDVNIFVLKNEKINVLFSKGVFHRSFNVNNLFYVREEGYGLKVYEKDSLRLIKGGEIFSNEKIIEILPYKENELIIIASKGISIYDTKVNKFYKSIYFDKVNKLLNKHLSFCGIKLKNGTYAIGTLNGGIIVIDSMGEIVTVFNTETGLQDNTILNLYSDKFQHLWVSTSNGISLVQNNLPFQQYTSKNGLKGKPICIKSIDNKIYIGTSQYLCVQNKNGNFDVISGTESQNWQMLDVNGMILLANTNGLFEIKGMHSKPILSNLSILNICSIYNKPKQLLIGTLAGVKLLEFNQNEWRIKNSIKGFNMIVHKLVQDKNEIIWASSNSKLYQLKLNKTLDSFDVAIQCTKVHGLPSDRAKPFLLNSGELVVGTEKGIYRYNETNRMFEKHPDFNMLSINVFTFEQQENGDIWFQETIGNGKYETGILKLTYGNFVLIKQPFYKFIDFAKNGNDKYFYTNIDSIVYICTVNGLLQYNSKHVTNFNLPFNTLIRKIYVKDSLFYGGANDMIISNKSNTLLYSQNNIIFHYAATFYENTEKNLYSYRLIGLDTTWSTWSSDFKKEYSNLHEGKYIFEVRAQNQYKVISNIASYSFRILPPWYRTWWAYLFYLMFFIVTGYIIIKIYTKRLKAANIRLEKIVCDRTAEIKEQAKELEIKNLELEKLSIVASETDNAVIIMDEKFNFEWINEGYVKLFGFSFNDLMLYYGGNLIKGSNYEKIEELTNKCIQTKKSVYYQSRIINQSALTLWVQTTITPILDNNGEIKKFVAIASDITELKKAEIKIFNYNREILAQNEEIQIHKANLETYNEELMATLEELQRRQEEIEYQARNLKNQNEKLMEMDIFKQNLFSMIVHDLKNPLNLILNIPQNIKLEKQIKIIQQSAKQMLNMVLNILDVDKYENGNMELVLEDKQFVIILQNAINQVKYLCEQKGISINNQIDSEVFVKVEEEIAERIIVNLLTNSIKFTPVGGNISLRSNNESDSDVKIEIEDTGEGIDEDKTHLVFQKFSQIVNKKSGGIRSSGLGLTFCKMAIEAHEGEIGFNSRQGKGTIFWFTLKKGNKKNIELEYLNYEKEFVNEEDIINFTYEEKLILEPIIIQLKAFTIYETDDIEEILIKMESVKTKNIEKWISQIKKYLLTLNQEKYLELLNLNT